MAIASQKITLNWMNVSICGKKRTYEIRFYAVILGVLIEDPIMLLPPIKIPLLNQKCVRNFHIYKYTYPPAPRIENPREIAIPK